MKKKRKKEENLRNILKIHKAVQSKLLKNVSLTTLNRHVLKYVLVWFGLVWSHLVGLILLVWSGLYGLFIGLVSIFLFFTISFL